MLSVDLAFFAIKASSEEMHRQVTQPFTPSESLEKLFAPQRRPRSSLLFTAGEKVLIARVFTALCGERVAVGDSSSPQSGNAS